MAISASSKILASDVTTALGTKIDTAGTGLSKSGTTLALASVVTAGTVGGTDNANLSFGSTFTTPYITYDAYGRITGSGTRSLALPSAPSGGTATTVSNVAVLTRVGINATNNHTQYGGFSATYGNRDSDGDYPIKVKLPSGGKWRWLTTEPFSNTGYAGESAGGTTLPNGYSLGIIAIRIS